MLYSKSKPLSSLIFIPLLSLVFIRPFISGLGYPLFEMPYEIILIALAIAALFIEASRFRIYPETFDNFPVLLLLLAYAVSSVFSINTVNSIRETFKFISLFAAFSIVSQADNRQKNTLIRGILLAASIISVYSIYQYLWGYDHTLAYLEKTGSSLLAASSYARDILIAKRAIATFPSPNIFGSYLIMMFFLSLSLAKDRGRGLSRYMPIVLITVSLVLTKSLGAWLSLIATLLILFIISGYPLKNRGLAFILGSVAAVFILVFILTSRWERFMDPGNPQNSITQRFDYWRTAIAVIKDHFLLGVGPGNFQEVFLKYKVGLSTDTRYAHNIFLQTWAETGVAGMAAMLWLIFLFFRKASRKPALLFIFLSGLAFILHNMVDNSYFIPETGLFWWLLLGLSLNARA